MVMQINLESRQLVGGDGKSYIWLETKGNYCGKTGIFEYIKDMNRLINHRYFNIYASK